MTIVLIQAWLHLPVVRGALVGFAVAALSDLHAWKSWGDAEFNIKTASFRWMSGAIFGAAAGSGLGAIS